MMLMPAIPNTVLDALGEEAARDLEGWLQAHLETIQRNQPPISPLVARQKVNVLMLEQVSNLLRAGEPTLERTADGAVAVDQSYNCAECLALGHTAHQVLPCSA